MPLCFCSTREKSGERTEAEPRLRLRKVSLWLFSLFPHSLLVEMMLRLSSSARSSLVAGRASAPAAAPLLRAHHAAAAAAVSASPFRQAAVAVRRSRFAVAAAAVPPSSKASSSSPSTPAPSPPSSPSSSSSSSPSSVDSSTPSPPSPAPPPPRFKIHSIAGDGSCLFRALAQGAHYLNASPSSSSSPRFSPEDKAAAAATTSSGGLGGGAGAFSLGAAPPPPAPRLLEGPELLAAGFAARRRICAALVRRRADVEPFLETPFHAYLDSMSAEGTWGGEPELSVAPEALGRPVCVYSRARDVSRSGKRGDLASLFFGDDIVKVREYGVADFEGDVAPICLLFGGLHYDLLIVEV